MDFLPDGFEKLKTQKSYWKMTEMKEGDNKFRIVQKPIAGWIDWKDKKPLRFKPDQKPLKAAETDKPIKPFWTCYVWDYAREALFVLEITQNSILKALTNYAADEDWGDFTKYDFKLKKEGSGKETKYSLTPLPHKELTSKIKESMKIFPVRLEALYEGGDPWTDLVEGKMNEKTGEIVNIKDFNQSFITKEQEIELLELMKGEDQYLQRILKHYKKDSLSKVESEHFNIIKNGILTLRKHKGGNLETA